MPVVHVGIYQRRHGTDADVERQKENESITKIHKNPGVLLQYAGIFLCQIPHFCVNNRNTA